MIDDIRNTRNSKTKFFIIFLLYLQSFASNYHTYTLLQPCISHVNHQKIKRCFKLQESYKYMGDRG